MSRERQDKMASIRNDFHVRSDAYDADIIRLVPGYQEMLQAAIDSIPFDDGSEPKVVDLGTGTGALSQRLLDRFPKARLLCVDMTEGMLTKAKERFAGYPQVTYLLKDFYELEIPAGQDAVMASLSLHHLITDDDKRSFYGKVHAALRPGGVFVNADAVLSSDDWVETLYKRKWREFMARSLDPKGVEEVMERHRKEDSLPVLSAQLKWLDEVGFSRTDVIWKNYMGAVVWARK